MNIFISTCIPESELSCIHSDLTEVEPRQIAALLPKMPNRVSLHHTRDRFPSVLLLARRQNFYIISASLPNFFFPHLSGMSSPNPLHLSPSLTVLSMGFTHISEDSSEIAFLLVENYNHDHSYWTSV